MELDMEAYSAKLKAEIDISLALRKELIEVMLRVRGPHSLRGYLEHAFTSGAYITREIADAVAQETLDRLRAEETAAALVTV